MIYAVIFFKKIIETVYTKQNDNTTFSPIFKKTRKATD